MPKRKPAAAKAAAEKPKVQSIGSLVNQLISRRGYAQVAATDQFHHVISAAVGRDLAGDVTVGKLNRGVLRVFASDSVTIQELMFQKRAIIKRIEKELPDAKVNDIRFKVLTQ
ncbi:DUF721 domain-containing protein [Stieleria sp. TO1_6]|uniref:DUF721 domain-containing protein n=1 Tax=Stieleria tagensis TaxID=2956795 RepID=UPI00209AD877|nr:DUF721 domain-containing protein [Stieleria tagensis]MCO8121731.1 DUF721 domain-containing protein [Stieleria tagensis]